MDRNRHRRHVPREVRQIPLVDQYMWPEKDSNVYHALDNGISHPVYDCGGWIHYSLPLEMWPKLGEIHPQVRHQMELARHYQRRERYTPLHHAPSPYGEHRSSCLY